MHASTDLLVLVSAPIEDHFHPLATRLSVRGVLSNQSPTHHNITTPQKRPFAGRQPVHAWMAGDSGTLEGLHPSLPIASYECHNAAQLIMHCAPLPTAESSGYGQCLFQQCFPSGCTQAPHVITTLQQSASRTAQVARDTQKAHTHAHAHTHRWEAAVAVMASAVDHRRQMQRAGRNTWWGS